MNEHTQTNIERIEYFLSGTMNSDEKRNFEAELEGNGALRDLLRIYKTIDEEMQESEKYSNQEEALKITLQQLNATYFNTAAPVVKMNKSRSLYRIAIAVAAMFVLILTGYSLFVKKTSDIHQLAEQYVKEELSHLSVTMDGARDSLQLGIKAYNLKQYSEALQLFEAVYRSHPNNNDALKYAGITYLATKQYSRALDCFDQLAGKKELFSNPGVFLKAVTLLQRNEGNDKEQAKLLLRQVAADKAEGSKEAANWLQE